MTGSVIRNARTIRSAGFRWSTTAPRSRRPISVGRTTDEHRRHCHHPRRAGLGRDRHRRTRRPGRRANRGQHGPAAPVDARRAAPDPRDRRRDGCRSPLRYRLSAHRHREEPGVPHLDAGRDLRDPDGLSFAVFQRDRLLPRGRATAGHHRGHSRARLDSPGDDDGTQPHLLTPGRAGHRRYGTGRDDGDVLRFPGTRSDLERLRGDHRTSDEQLLHPARWAGRRPARGRRGPGCRTVEDSARQAHRTRRADDRELHLQGPNPGRRLPGPDRLHGVGDDRRGAALHRPAA